MSEQKYYVRLKSIIVNVRDYSDDEHYISGTNFYLDVLKEFSPDEVKHEFTKSELSKIMNGALYSVSDEKCNYCIHSGDTCGDEHCEEWINPLIELVPVGDNE